MSGKLKKKPVAKAKTPKARAATQKRLEENSTPLEVRKSDAVTLHSKHQLPFNEVKNVVAQTILRVLPEEFGISVDPLNAREYHAHLITLQLKYGTFGEDGRLKRDGGIKMQDHGYKRIPLCREHKR